jgi:hypothetical protein
LSVNIFCYLSDFYYTFMVELKKYFKVGVYTGMGFVTSYAPQIAGWLSSFPVWISQYQVQVPSGTQLSWADFKKSWLPKYDPNLKGMGITQDVIIGHQFTGDRALLPGTYSYYLPFYKKRVPVDVSVFKQSLVSDVGNPPISITPPPVVTPIAPMYKAKVLTYAANVRSAPNGTILFSIPQNSVVSIYGVNNGWGRIDAVNDQWVYLSNLGRLP